MDVTWNRKIAMATLFGGGVSLLLSLFTLNTVAIAISSICFVLTILIWKYGHILMPMFFRLTRVVEVRDGYEIPPERDCIVKKEGPYYYVSRFIGVNITESVTEKSTEEKAMMMEYFERAISSLKSVAKLSVLVHNVDLRKAIEEIKSKRSWCETKIAQLRASSDPNKEGEITRLEREVAMYNKLLERMNTGERPMEVIAYIMTTAKGASREEAMAQARAQAMEIKSVVGNALNVETFDLKGEDMELCFMFERTIPPTEEEFKNVIY